MPAALLVSTVHAALHMAQHRLLDLPGVAANLNNLILDANPGNKFVTAAFVVWNSESKELAYLSAGHEPPFIIRRNGKLEFLSKGGMVLGLFPDMQYPMIYVDFEPGDVLVLYTDGITDVRNSDNERFGIERFTELCTQSPGSSAEEMVETIFQAIGQFKKELPAPDDETVVVIRRT